jgi:hypothetical protein
VAALGLPLAGDGVAARMAGAAREIRHHGDFDGAGVAIFRDLSAWYGAVPWRFDRDALVAALGRAGESVGEGSLDELVRGLRRAIPEELLVDKLIDDLRRGP